MTPYALRDNSEVATKCPDVIKGHIEKQNEVLKERLKTELKKCSSVAISLDAWTSVNKTAFLCIVGHWVNDEWNKQEAILDFSEPEGEHTGENMAAAVLSCLKEFDIQKKFICITGDNASNNLAMARELLNS